MSFHLHNGSQELDQILRMNPGGVVLLDFFAQWCGPCKRISPELDELARTTRIVLVKVDVDADGNEDLVSACAIKAMPTLMWLKDGKTVHRLEGADLPEIKRVTAGLVSH